MKLTYTYDQFAEVYNKLLSDLGSKDVYANDNGAYELFAIYRNELSPTATIVNADGDMIDCVEIADADDVNDLYGRLVENFKYELRNTFEIFGDPCPAIFETRELAESAMAEGIRGLADDIWQKNEAGIYIIEAQDAPTGRSHECAWQERLEETAGCTVNDDGEVVPGEITPEKLYDLMAEAFEIEPTVRG